jgi:mono/diheme cytochrome c family protein
LEILRTGRKQMDEFRKKFRSVLMVSCLFFLAGALTTVTQGTENAYGADPEAGKKVYEKYCTICHGAKGDGKGLVGIIHRVEKSGLVWSVYPRDFTVGVYKFRSTSTGCLPDDTDLMRMITEGIPRAGMPSHEDVSFKDREDVIEYIKTFSPRWEEEDSCEMLVVVMPHWVGDASSVAKGEKVYKDMKCGECHGDTGRGDGPKADKLKDDWGDKILPFDFTSGALKRGSSPENVYITFTTGLDGTGMPSYADSLQEEDRWHLVSYTLKLMGMAK